jgi:nucleoside-diphosphate-sugar epimerase
MDIRPPRLSVPYALAAALAGLSEGFARFIGTREPPSLTRTSLFLMAQDQRYDISKARRDLGWQPRVGMEEGVRRAAEWARAEGLV